MKGFLFIFVSLALLLGGAAFAQSAIAGCPSQDSLTFSINNCTVSGFGHYTYYDQFDCKRIACNTSNIICPNADQLGVLASRCNDSGHSFEYYYDENKCQQVKCVIPANGTQCPNVDQLGINEQRCKDAGAQAEHYQDANKCEQVRCIHTTVTTCPTGGELEAAAAKCMDSGFQYELYVDSECNKIRCTNASIVCPPEFDINLEAERCKVAGLEYQFFYDNYKCRQVSCTQPPNCAAAAVTAAPVSIDAQISACKDQGLDYEITKDTGTGCPKVSCVSDMCPNADALGTSIKLCQAKGMSYETYADAADCKQINCIARNETTDCKKLVDDAGCTVVSCVDGYFYNSCDSQKNCRVTCESSFDEAKCKVTTCSDGSTTRDCPQGQVECQSYTDDFGCQNKQCSDGTKSRSCPPVECNGTSPLSLTNAVGAFNPVPCTQCEDFTNENGCRVKSCANGYQSTDCPTTSEGNSNTCNVFIDENNCTVKECDNGYRFNNCTPMECTKAADADNCTLVNCTNGYFARQCPANSTLETIECQKLEIDNCNVTKCTDGYTDRVCGGGLAAPTGAAPGNFTGNQTGNQTGTQGGGDPISAFFKWLSSLFGGK